MSKPEPKSHRSPAEWSALVGACEKSGLSRRAFAEREGLNAHTFAWWASRLSPKRFGGRRKAKPDSKPAFVPVSVGPRGTHERGGTMRVAAAQEGSVPVEIVLANGRRVRCTLAQAGDPRLTALLAAVEGGR